MISPVQETKLRMAAFGLYYDHIYSDVQDHTLRFALAIVSSSRPLVKPELIQQWLDAPHADRVRDREFEESNKVVYKTPRF